MNDLSSQREFKSPNLKGSLHTHKFNVIKVDKGSYARKHKVTIKFTRVSDLDVSQETIHRV